PPQTTPPPPGGAPTPPPRGEPMLNQPIATDRSLAGNHSLVALTPAGMPAASARPSTPRNSARLRQPVAQAAAAQATDHASANAAKPSLVPTVSSTKPATGCMNA